MRKKIFAGLILFMFMFSLLPAVFAAEDCPLGQVYVSGVGCQEPQIKVTKTVRSADGTAIASSVGGGLEAIRIDNPFTAPGQPVLVELTISNIGAQYPFNLIPLPPNQYAFVMTIDPVDKIVFKKEDGTYDRYDINSVEWGSWFGSDWFAKSWFFLKKSIKDFDKITSEDICKYINVADMFPDFAKKRFIYDTQEKVMEERHGRITDDNFYEKIDANDIKEFFPAVYEWECIRSIDRETFENEIQQDYCGNTVTMGCMGKYMQENIGSLKTSSFIVLTDEVGEGKCEYDKGDGITYCGVGQDGICPEGLSSCDGKSEYTFEFVMLVPADAPALSPSEFEQLINDGEILGDFRTSAATGETYNFGYTENAVCPGDDLSAGCHTLNVRVQAINRQGLVTLFKSFLGGAAVGTGAGLAVGGAGVVAGSILGSVVGLVKGVMTWGSFELIGAPIYEGQGIFYVVAPALKVTALFTLWLAVLAGAGSAFLIVRRS